MIILGKPIHRKYNKLIVRIVLTFILLGVLYAII